MFHLRALTAADLTDGLRLSELAGWNQTARDWRRAMELQPDGCFVAVIDSAIVGTATACVMGDVAWVALVLVDAARRRQGIGRALMQHVLTWLDERGVVSVRLDATLLGQPLYERLGFIPSCELVRFEGVLSSLPGREEESVVPVPEPRWEELLALDQSVTSTPRERFLRGLFAEQPEAVRGVPGDPGWRGYMTCRTGRCAVQLGPCIGPMGDALLRDAFRRHAGHRVYVDVPVENREATALVESVGLRAQRTLMRMDRGSRVRERLDWLWASAGPEKG